MSKHYMKETGPTTVEVVSQDADKTVLKVLVTRNGGPTKKDLHQEFFTGSTYFGDDVITAKFGTYEHMMNPTHNPFAPDDVETQILGKAELIENDEMGRWFRFEIDRKNQYHDYIMELKDMKCLGASTQCLPGGKRKNADTGEITHWVESEVCVTPTPADPGTINQITALAKYFVLPDLYVMMAAEEADTTPPAATPEVPATDAPATETDDKPKLTLEQQMDALLAPQADPTDAAPVDPPADPPATGDDASKTVTVPAGDFKALNDMVKSQGDELKAMKSWIWGSISLSGSPGEGETLMDVLAGMRQLVGDAVSGQEDTQKALLKFAGHVAKDLQKRLGDDLKKSAAEREADSLLEQGGAKGGQQGRHFKSSIPDNAPGD